MIKLKEAVIVEGRYDKLKLANFIDALIIETNGFGIYRDKEKLKFIRALAEDRGIIILTDSDHSGFQIRNYIAAGIPKDRIKHIYIPDIYGKEKRKSEQSKEGKLGVEGMSDELLIRLFENAGISAEKSEIIDSVTNYDLYALGFSGTPDAKQNRKKLLKALDLPEFLSVNSLLTYINTSMTKEEFYRISEKF